jgi:hypothetical protein
MRLFAFLWYIPIPKSLSHNICVVILFLKRLFLPWFFLKKKGGGCTKFAMSYLLPVCILPHSSSKPDSSQSKRSSSSPAACPGELVLLRLLNECHPTGSVLMFLFVEGED